MPTVCPSCHKECSHDVTHCPHCGYHVAEHVLREQEEISRSAIKGWQSSVEILKADNTRLRASLAAAEELADAICHVYMVLIDAGDIEQADAITKARNKFLATLPKQDSEESCPVCDGKGYDDEPRGPLQPSPCRDCGGEGVVHRVTNYEDLGVAPQPGEPCFTCGGTGKRPDTEEEP